MKGGRAAKNKTRGETPMKKQEQQHAYRAGQDWFFRTVTFHAVGRIRAVYGLTLELEQCSHVGWPAERVGEIFKHGKISDCEKLPDGYQIHIAALTDATPWSHPLPSEKVT